MTNSSQLNLGIVSTSGGAMFQEILIATKKANFPINFFVVTDRACAIEDIAKRSDVRVERFETKDNQKFSILSANYFKSHSTQAVLLNCVRLVSKELFSAFPTFNIHPSLLPEFPGLFAIDDFIKSGSRKFGATLHLVDEKIDGGPIITQVAYKLMGESEEKTLNWIAFIHKCYLSLLLFELLERHELEINLGTAHVKLTSETRLHLRTPEFIAHLKNLQDVGGISVIDL